VAKPIDLGTLADLVGGRLSGDPALMIEGAAPVDEAEAGEIAFLAVPRYTRHLAACRAQAYLVSTELSSALPSDVSSVVVADPYPALRALLKHFTPPETWAPSVHPTVVLGENVDLAEGVEIGAYAVLESGVRVGTGSRIGAHCVLGRGTTVGQDTRLYPHVVTYFETSIGDAVIIHSGVCLGVDGFGYTLIDGQHAKMPQVGRCVIEDGVEIGANTSVDRGSLGDTRIASGVKIDNLVHIAHNVKIGALSLIAAMSGVAGSTRLGKGVWMGGQSGAVNQIEIGDGVRIAGRSGVTRDIPAGETVSGFPARLHTEEMWRQARIDRIPKLLERMRTLEAEVAALKGK
jgi:UDP-3-O-[3-hydroxymyristoyl] glucosamine N-acyltransferase